MPLTYSEPDALARVYAKSLFELANEAGGQEKAEDVLREIEEILELARTDRAFGEFLASRILPSESRSKSIENIFKGRISDLTLRFLQILNEKGRLSHLPPIAGALDAMVQQAYGRVEVDVYTATQATQSELDTIRQKLSNVLGKEPVLHSYTDPSLIGGVRLQIGDQLIDASIASGLRRMRERLNIQGSDEIRAKAGKFFQSEPGQNGTIRH